MPRLSDAAHDQLYHSARSHPTFAGRPVADAVLEDLTRLALLAPSAFNQQSLRLVFVATPEGKAPGGNRRFWSTRAGLPPTRPMPACPGWILPPPRASSDRARLGPAPGDVPSPDPLRVFSER